jgi:hypothetical protein
MAKKRPRRSQARYPQEPLPDWLSIAEVRGPWTTQADRARALMALLPTGIRFDPARLREYGDKLESAKAHGIDEDGLCAALYTGVVEHYWELVRSQQARIHQELDLRIRRVRRDLPPLLQELWLIANDEEARDLTSRLAYWMKHAAWIDFSSKKRRSQAGNPLRTVLRKTRERLRAVGVTDYEWQSEWLTDIGLIQTPPPSLNRAMAKPAASPGESRSAAHSDVTVTIAPWAQAMMRKPAPENPPGQ